MFYYLVIAFHAFCLFHVYKSKNDNYWYFVIFLVPIIGSLIYLFTQIINKRNIENITDNFISIINPKKKIRDLEKQLSFSNTFQNNINLANAHKENQDYLKAISYYENAMVGKFKDHPGTIYKIIKCYFQLKEYIKVLEYASKIDTEKHLKDSSFIYAISLEKCNYFDEAEIQYRKTDQKYINYGERLELSKFLIRRDKKEEAKIVLEEIIVEISNMIESNKDKFRYIYQESQQLLNKIKSS